MSLNTSVGTIAILVPTRGRPQRLVGMMQSAIAMALNPELIEFVVYFDHDDIEIPSEIYNYKTRVIKGPKLWLSSMYNACAAISSAQYLMYGSDDIMFATKSWDYQVRNAIDAFPNQFGLVFPNDLSSYKGTLATHGFVHKKWIDTFGYFLPPYFPDVYGDTWLTAIAQEIGRLSYLEEVVVEHNQYRQGKANFDATYASRVFNVKIAQANRTFLKLQREFRVHVVLACTHMEIRIPKRRMYWLANLVTNRLGSRISHEDRLRLLSSTNFEIIKRAIFKIGTSIWFLFSKS